MPFSPDPRWDWLKVLFFTCLAFLGGSLGYTIRTLDSEGQVIWWRVVLEGLSAVFFAMITGVICMERGLSFGWSSAVIGMTSWIGSRATLLLIQTVILNKVGARPEDINERDNERD